MIRMIIFLSFVLISGVFAEYCKDTESNYTLYAGDLPDGQKPEDICGCMKATLEKNGALKDKPFECIKTEGLDQIKFETARDDGTRPECTNCFGCKKVTTNNPADSTRICEIIRKTPTPTEPVTEVGGRVKRGLWRWRCFLVSVWRWGWWGFGWWWCWKWFMYWQCWWTF